MILKIATFASFREQLGSSSIELELSEPATVGDLKQVLITSHPELMPLIKRSAVSVNQEYADDSKVLDASDEVALIPPVSGG